MGTEMKMSEKSLTKQVAVTSSLSRVPIVSFICWASLKNFVEQSVPELG
jgi:hypothetical protein